MQQTRIRPASLCILIAILLQLPSIILHAAPCPQVRLDATGPAANLPVYDQDGTGTCFANAAATLEGHWLRTHAPPEGDPDASHVPFPLELAARYSAKTRKNGINEGGSAAEVLEMAKSDGTCDPTQSKNTSGESTHVSEWFSKHLREFDKCKAASSAIRSLQPEHVTCPFKSSGPPEKLPDLNFIEKSLGTQETLEAIQKAALAVCPASQRKYPKGYQVEIKSPTSPTELTEDLCRHFSGKQPQPVAVAYCANLLTDTTKAYAGLTWTRGQRPEAQADCEKHESVVIGTKLGSDGELYFLVQNSWGKSCDAYQFECKDGKIWIPANLLAQNTLRTTRLKPQPARVK